MSLESDLESALLDAIRGETVSPHLEGRLSRTARAVLLRHGLSQATITVARSAEAYHVRITLPRARAVARTLTLTLSPL